MNAEVAAGLAMTAFFAFFRYRFGTVPHRVSEAGMVGGFLVASWIYWMPSDMKPPLASLAFFFAGCLCFGAAVHFYVSRPAVAQEPARARVEIAQITDKPTQSAPGGIINNQSGGTSNNKVYNFGVSRPPRQLSEAAFSEAKEQLKALPTNKKITVQVPLGSPQETLAFANQIRDFLIASGHSVTEVTIAALAKPFYGLSMVSGSDPLRLIVGPEE